MYQFLYKIQLRRLNLPLPDLRVEIAQCERHGKMHDMYEVHFTDLTGSRR
jgi:hypothetical protein